MSSVTSSTATKSPNFFVMRSTLTKGLALGSVQGSNLSCLSRGEVAMRLRAIVSVFYGPARLAWLPPDPSLNPPGSGAAGSFRTAPVHGACVSSLTRREAGPRPVEEARVLVGLRQIREQLGLDLRRRINTGVVAHVLVDQRH